MIHRLDIAALPDFGDPSRVPFDAPRSEGGPRARSESPWPFDGGEAHTWGAKVHVALEDGRSLDVDGDAFAIADRGAVGVVLDRRTGTLRRVDLAALTSQPVLQLEGQIERQVRPVLSIDPEGAKALVMEGKADGRVWLLEVDLESGAGRPVHGPLPPRSWVVGAFASGGGIIALEQRFEPAPQARLLALEPRPHVLTELAVVQPMLRPLCPWPGIVLAVLTVQPHGLASYGPTDLFAISVPGGARRQLTRLGDLRGSPRLSAGRVEVDGRDARWRLEVLRAGGPRAGA